MAKKFWVEVKEVHTVTVPVESDKENPTRQELAEMANKIIEATDDLNIAYDYTLEPDSWTIRDNDGNFIK